MNRQALGVTVLALALGLAATASAETHTYFGFTLGIGGAPPPPPIVYEAPPPMVYDPDAEVYVVENPYNGCDEFRYGPYWYVYTGNYWYRARSYRGPFAVVDVRYVPRRVFAVPAGRWHHYPPGLARWRGAPGRGWDADRGWNRGRGWEQERGWERGDRGDDRGNKGWDKGNRGNGKGRGRGHEDRGDRAAGD